MGIADTFRMLPAVSPPAVCIDVTERPVRGTGMHWASSRTARGDDRASNAGIAGLAWRARDQRGVSGVGVYSSRSVTSRLLARGGALPDECFS